MLIKEYKTDLGIIRIEEKNNPKDKEVFVGAIKLTFEPILPKTKDKELKIFSIDYPRESNNFENKYEYFFSWYKDGRNVNNSLIGDE